jgi:hypothetical protein
MNKSTEKVRKAGKEGLGEGGRLREGGSGGERGCGERERKRVNERVCERDLELRRDSELRVWRSCLKLNELSRKMPESGINSNQGRQEDKEAKTPLESSELD